MSGWVQMICRLALMLVLLFLHTPAGAANDQFTDVVAPLLASKCLSCHNDEQSEGDLSLVDPHRVVNDGLVDRKEPLASRLLEVLVPHDGQAEMPKDADPLKPDQIRAITRWIQSGATIPHGYRIRAPRIADLDWWSLQPIPSLEKRLDCDAIDHAIETKLRENGLSALPQAPPEVLIRRLTYDLTGLPPDVSEIERFESQFDRAPEAAWNGLVDRLLAAPEFGEKFGQHWLDVARYAETHGYDKDQPRNNAWPYRDYVVNSFNEDKPFATFAFEQIAGDAIANRTPDSIAATGFLAAGPWDLIAHVEVGEGKLDGRIAKHLDRDEMVSAVFNVFQSTTIGCAQCHHHKFDPITSEDYYRVQAVFAGIDRADRVYDGLSDQQVQEKRALTKKRAALIAERDKLTRSFEQKVAAKTETIDARLKALNELAEVVSPPTQHGYHSLIESKPNATKWVQVDLGRPLKLSRIELASCYDDFNSIGAGFGFPVRFKIQITSQAEFDDQTCQTILDHTESDFSNPGAVPVRVDFDPQVVQIIRVTATKLAERRNDYILALGELSAFAMGSDQSLSIDTKVSASDSIPANSRWAPRFLVDGRFHAIKLPLAEQQEWQKLKQQRRQIVKSLAGDQHQNAVDTLNKKIASAQSKIDGFPAGKLVFAAATDFSPRGQFRPTEGKLRPIHFLHRGDLRSPGDQMLPGGPRLWHQAPSRFFEHSDYKEQEARIALAEYVTRRDNPLFWRSAANRIWQWCFGKPIVETPNDFGRMGAQPTHAILLDRLAATLRDDPQQSIKSMVRMLVHTKAYRRASTGTIDSSIESRNRLRDAGNRLLWRYNLRRLTAEEFRDSVLAISGALQLSDRGGPSFKDFVVEHPQHSPHYEYHLHDPSDAKTHRRTIYRFVVRSQPQPLLTTLDCADPSISVARRDESTTALQALVQWNHRSVETMSVNFANRLRGVVSATQQDQTNQLVDRGCQMAWGRGPTSYERQTLHELISNTNLETFCRVLFNSSALMYVE